VNPLRLTLLFALIGGSICRAAIVIPIEIEKNNVFAAARINGVDVKLGIDSGGGVVALKRAVIAKVRAVPSGAVIQSTDVLGHSTDESLLTLDTLEMGGKIFAHVDAVDAGEYPEGTPGDGVVGRRLLNKFIVVYDYASRKVTLFTPEERRAAKRECRGTRVHTVPDPEEINVSLAKTDHGVMRLVWDSGATYSVVRKEFSERQQLPLDDIFYNTRSFVIGGRDFGPLQLAAIEFHAPANADGFIGHNFFLNHVVCIDPTEQTVKVR